ncbi:hypothetical protein Tco_0302256, partial [Tanacetum coccineum]
MGIIQSVEACPIISIVTENAGVELQHQTLEVKGQKKNVESLVDEENDEVQYLDLANLGTSIGISINDGKASHIDKTPWSTFIKDL